MSIDVSSKIFSLSGQSKTNIYPIEDEQYILAEKRNASINSGVVFLTKIVDFI